MSSNLNLSAWKQMENTWADALVDDKDVKIRVEAIFNGASQRPSEFKIHYTIGEQPFLEKFKNE